MAVPEKIASLERFIQTNPAMADVPILTVAGRPTTLREALGHLRAGVYVSEVMTGLAALGLDLPWELCQEFYRRLAAARPEVKLATLMFIPPMGPAEALRHIEARDEVGGELVKAYASMLSFIKTRVDT